MEEIVRVLESIFGKSDDGLNGHQIMFDCPHCHDENEGKSQKFSVNIGGYCQCWRCGSHGGAKGLVTSVIKKYYGISQLNRYIEAIKEYKNSKSYELEFKNNNLVIIETTEEDKILLPDSTYSFKFDGNEIEHNALNYLISRGFTKEMIIKYSLKYTNNDTKNKSFKNRIIIPSYDKYGQLNYYTGRDYTGKSKFKYFNCEDTERKDIIFNEHLINWDGDIHLVEGPLDSLCVPNSIPLMGKSLKYGDYIFNMLLKNAKSDIIVFLDSDALIDSKNICSLLVDYGLCDKVKYIKTDNLLYLINNKKNTKLDKLDPSRLYEIGGYKAISWALKKSKYYPCI